MRHDLHTQLQQLPAEQCKVSKTMSENPSEQIILTVDRRKPGETRVVIGLPPATWAHLRRGNPITVALGDLAPVTLVLTGGRSMDAVAAAVDAAT